MNSNILYNEPKRKGLLHNYVLRDILVWMVFLFLLPIVLFCVYFFTKESSSFSSSFSLASSSAINQYEDSLESSSSLMNVDLTINFNNILDNFKNRPMRRVSLSNYENALCNDGTVANYYIRKSKTNSKTWIILLDGGYFCYDSVTCKQRSLNSFNLTSSSESRVFKFGNYLKNWKINSSNF
jgi:hypothetical protein